MKGTRLWNAPRSPLIEGRSRRQSTFASDWVRGSVVGFVLAFALSLLFFADKDSSDSTLVSLVVIPSVLGAAIGSSIGVGLAAGFGWHPRWVSGGVTSSLTAIAAVAAVFFIGRGAGV